MLKTRYAYGGDEHIFVEVDEKMSLEAFFKSLSMTNAIREKSIAGVDEICPSNASFQVKYNPDIISCEQMLKEIKEIEKATNSEKSSDKQLKTRVIEVPVFYQDPWTTETLMRFRERHQEPTGTDLDYAAKINGYPSVAKFIEAHHGSPWIVTMVGFVAGLPFMYQMVERSRQIEVPKYLRPRTDTPKLTVGYGGCFSCIYSVRGAGGYQMFGITPMPIYDPTQNISYMKDFMIFFKPGDIVKFKPVNREEHDRIQAQAETGEFKPKIKDVDFSLEEYMQDLEGTNRKLMEALNAN